MTTQLTATSTQLTEARGRGQHALRNPLLIFLGALAVGLAMVFVGFHMQNFVDTKFDPYDFGAMGKSVARGNGFAPFGSLIERRAPLYPLMIGAVYFLFGEQPNLVFVMQCLLLAGSCVLVFDIGRRCFNQRTGFLAALLCALNPMLLRYVGDLQLETLLTFLITAMVWAAVRFNTRPSLGLGVLIGVTAALASLTKSVALPFPFFFALIFVGKGLLQRRHDRNANLALAPLAAMFVTMALLIAPWTVRNYVATGGHFVLLSSGTSDAFLRGYIFSQPEYATLRLPPYEYAENASNEWFTNLSISAGTTWMKDDYETDQLLNRAALQKLVAEPGDFVRKFGVGIFTFWYEMTSLSTSLVAGVLALVTWAFAIVGIRRAIRERISVWVLILPALYLNVLLAALLALGRYSVPILPALLVVSAFGLEALWSRREAARA